MTVTVCWDTATDQPPARTAAWRSMNAVTAKDKEAWLELFHPDGVVEDPVGVSMFDETGRGHRGRAAIAAFWEAAIAGTERIDFVLRDSHAAGDEVANVGTITSYLPGGYRVDTDGVFVYRVDGDGLIVSMRAFWEVERAMATTRPVE
ncbi:nuclear transport factor 2 family protein [Saccharomonospora iraqiensis]|uniref:nuclear transport factor 2 family protein n=1 Tax=Saccharomonospora iraqiensis TaxID=52698 RepID=UPI00022E89A8|nr:nuclear transport factor 2 family protein [Saccharomonospora iraqiensis]